MPRKAKELSALEVSRLRDPGFYFVGGVAGLALQILSTGGRSWILRVMIGGRRRDMGLGGFPDVTLADARAAAREKRRMIDEGLDPVEERRAAQSRLRAERAVAVTFEEAAAQYIKAHEPSWKNAKHAQQWRNTLTTYAYPKLGRLLVKDIGLAQVLSVLEGIWLEKTETATRVRSRIELVLDWATARGYREGLNPARWRGNLDALLAKPGKVAKAQHFPALAVSQIAAFMQALREQDGMGARAVEFAILCASRSGEVRGATWSEVDIDKGIWTIPAGRMKGGKEHRVPLAEPALKVLKNMPKRGRDEHVFPGAKKGTPLSDMTMTATLRRMNEGGPRWIDPRTGAPVVVHGFRSTFRDWASERTSYPNEMAELALAHAIGDKVEAAYRRGDMFEKRRRMMADWAAFCDRIEKPAEVIPMKTRAGR